MNIDHKLIKRYKEKFIEEQKLEKKFNALHDKLLEATNGNYFENRKKQKRREDLAFYIFFISIVILLGLFQFYEKVWYLVVFGIIVFLNLLSYGYCFIKKRLLKAKEKQYLSLIKEVENAKSDLKSVHDVLGNLCLNIITISLYPLAKNKKIEEEAFIRYRNLVKLGFKLKYKTITSSDYINHFKEILLESEMSNK